jgi:hypothetical protein
MTENKVFQVELCQEDAIRIVKGIWELRIHEYSKARQSDPNGDKQSEWVEYEYVSALWTELVDKFSTVYDGFPQNVC